MRHVPCLAAVGARPRLSPAPRLTGPSRHKDGRRLLLFAREPPRVVLAQITRAAQSAGGLVKLPRCYHPVGAQVPGKSSGVGPSRCGACVRCDGLGPPEGPCPKPRGYVSYSSALRRPSCQPPELLGCHEQIGPVLLNQTPNRWRYPGRWPSP